MNAPAGSFATQRAGASHGARPIRLLIVDDSLVVRTILRRMLAEHGEFEVVDAVGDVDRAAAVLDAHEIDIVLLDIQMPGTDGITALPELLRRGKGARILIVSSITVEGAAASMRAMTQGAADTLLKPSAGSFGNRFAATLCERLIRIGPVERSGRRGPAIARAADLVLAPRHAGPVDCVAIASSTGGIHALSAFFKRLPARVTAPILVTQHLPESFMPFFANQLRELSGRVAAVAGDGVALVPGTILVAPGDAHLGVIRIGGQLRVRLDRAQVASRTMPSADPMLASLADAAGPRTVAVVLSGMGRDGALGAARLAAAGGEILAQDLDSSVIWGMPGAVARAGLSSQVAPAGVLAERIAARIDAAAGQQP